MNTQKIRLGPLTAAIATVLILGNTSQATGIEPYAGGDAIFSLDIGSDKEISDPGGGATELLDPGDLYSSAAASLGGAPFLDDANIFGSDPHPIQGDTLTAVPVGSPGSFTAYFDLDGYDALSVSLTELPIGQQLPRSQYALPCVTEATRLVVSFDDDRPANWRAGGGVPTTGTSATGVTYGTTAGIDELVGIEVDVSPFRPRTSPAAVIATVPLVSEGGLHPALLNNPGPEKEDDDVDALNVAGSIECNYHYFSADNEARVGLRALDIYESNGAGTIRRVIRPYHLGFGGNRPTPDIDAFEFAWLPDESGDPQPGDVPGEHFLAFLFSVDVDDPLTGKDESAGLDPAAIYASFLTGDFFEFVRGEQNGFDDIDAIATVAAGSTDTDADGVPDSADNCTAVANPAQRDTDGDGIGNYCDPDLDNDCDVDADDLAIFRSRFFSSDPDADFNGDGTVKTDDLAVLGRYFGGSPGPSGVVNICS